ncbi:glycosyltransferase involved in cell wall biosynthesis [Nakamurella sp. UYEF19]|uniref:glycosyltransferase n=1 Tax=Nakamurella sp. UYEF19 TaxID=1756392 RepID=UPI00339A976D
MPAVDRLRRVVTSERLRKVSRTLRPTRSTAAAVAADIDRHGAGRRQALRDRIGVLVRTLDPGSDLVTAVDGPDTEALLTALTSAIEPVTPERAWLLLAVIDGRLPDGDLVRATVRTAELDGVPAALRKAIWSGPLPRVLDNGPWRPIQVVTGQVIVDVHHTAQTGFATGIQRVTREVTRRWAQLHHPLMVGWTPDLGSVRALTPPEARRAFWGGPPVDVPNDDPIIVPWGCTYLLPELAAEVDRTGRLQALARYSGSSLRVIGYDLVPVTTAETAHEGLVPGFARNLAALRHATSVVPISEGAAVEYRGWRAMLTGTGLTGPEIIPVVLPAEAPPDNPVGTQAAARRLLLGDLPLVLVVGSHEPRKNHVAVLHAAELLWREGARFSLTFIGGNSWNSQAFLAGVARLQLAGRPIETIAAAGDDLLWGAYRTARFTVFPSINEGFGLPVAESLASGTPVITSNYGTMKEIADAGGGALLVDPRNDHSLADAMRTLLQDDAELARLRREAATRPKRTWDDYAGETWAALMGLDTVPSAGSNGA